MIKKKRALCLVVLCLLTCGLPGCATSTKGDRFYIGPPQPGEKTALVYAVSGCSISDFRGEREKEAKLSGTAYLLDLLPGQYIAGVKYAYNPGRVVKTGGRVQLSLNVQAGNIYVIYPQMTGLYLRETWRPIFMNIKDYNKDECKKHFDEGWGCPDKDSIREAAAKYLQSERQ